MQNLAPDSDASLHAITGVVEYLSAAYSAIGLYESDHPLVAALAEAVADAVAPLMKSRSKAPYSVEIACGAFLWQGAPIPPKLVSQLAADLHALNAVELELCGSIDAASTHTLLTAIHRSRHSGGSIDDVIRVAEGIAGRPIRLIPLRAGEYSARSLSIADSRQSGGGFVSDAELAAMLRQPPEDPGVLSDHIVRRLEAGNADEAESVRAWLQTEADAACRGDADQKSARKAWLESCVQRLTPEVRDSLLRSVPQPDPDWLMSVATLAPVWPVDELIAALESLTGDVTSLRGTGRLLFTQLLGLARRDDQQQRVRSIIETWGANRPDSSVFASDSGGGSDDAFRGEDYADELVQYAQRRTADTGQVRLFELEDDDTVAIRAAEIAIGLGEESYDPDLAAMGVSRTADSLLRQSRTDLVLRALTRDVAPDADGRTLSRCQQRLIAVLRKPDCIRSLLEAFATETDDAGVVQLLDLAREHAASLVLEFSAETASEPARSRALAWFRSLPPELRASAIGEFLSASPGQADLLEPVCESVEAFQIGHCVEHLVSGDQPGHTCAVLRVLGWCVGEWPASVVHHIIGTPHQHVLDEAFRSLASGPAQTRSVTIARVLCSLASLRQMPIARMSSLVDTLRHDQPVAERAFVELLTVIRARPSMIARGDADPILAALAQYATVSESTRRAVRGWRSPAIRLLSLMGRIRGTPGEERRCA